MVEMTDLLVLGRQYEHRERVRIRDAHRDGQPNNDQYPQGMRQAQQQSSVAVTSLSRYIARFERSRAIRLVCRSLHLSLILEPACAPRLNVALVRYTSVALYVRAGLPYLLTLDGRI